MTHANTDTSSCHRLTLFNVIYRKAWESASTSLWNCRHTAIRSITIGCHRPTSSLTQHCQSAIAILYVINCVCAFSVTADFFSFLSAFHFSLLLFFVHRSPRYILELFILFNFYGIMFIYQRCVFFSSFGWWLLLLLFHFCFSTDQFCNSMCLSHVNNDGHKNKSWLKQKISIFTMEHQTSNSKSNNQWVMYICKVRARQPHK